MSHPNHLGLATPPGLGLLNLVIRSNTLEPDRRIQGYRVWHSGSQLLDLVSRLKALEYSVENGPKAPRFGVADTLT